MQKQLKDIANIKFGLYVKPLEKGFAKYLQAKNFDDYGNLQSDWTYYIRLDKKLRDLKLHKLTLNHEKKKQKLQPII